MAAILKQDGCWNWKLNLAEYLVKTLCIASFIQMILDEKVNDLSTIILCYILCQQLDKSLEILDQKVNDLFSTIMCYILCQKLDANTKL